MDVDGSGKIGVEELTHFLSQSDERVSPPGDFGEDLGTFIYRYYDYDEEEGLSPNEVLELSVSIAMTLVRNGKLDMVDSQELGHKIEAALAASEIPAGINLNKE